MSRLSPPGGEQAAESAFSELFRRLSADESANISRIDIACDDREGILDMEQIVEKVRSNKINSRMTKRSIVVSYDGTQRSGSTVYIGAPSSSPSTTARTSTIW